VHVNLFGDEALLPESPRSNPDPPCASTVLAIGRGELKKFDCLPLDRRSNPMGHATALFRRPVRTSRDLPELSRVENVVAQLGGPRGRARRLALRRARRRTIACRAAAEDVRGRAGPRFRRVQGHLGPEAAHESEQGGGSSLPASAVASRSNRAPAAGPRTSPRRSRQIWRRDSARAKLPSVAHAAGPDRGLARIPARPRSFHSPGRTRTSDHSVNSRTLYRLSYRGPSRSRPLRRLRNIAL
jgi:hypothetical protein